MKLYKFPNNTELINEKGEIIEKTCYCKDEIIELNWNNISLFSNNLKMSLPDSVNLDIYPRKCNRCLQGIHKGYVVYSGTFCGDCIDNYCQTIGFNGWHDFLNRDSNDDFIPKEERDEDEDYTTDDCYWTEWYIDITDCAYLENGLELDLSFKIKHRLLLTLSEMIDGNESTQKCLITVGNDETIEECIDKYISEFRGGDSEKEGHLHYSFLGGSISVKFDNYKSLSLDEYSLLEKLFYGVGEYTF